MDYSEEFVEMCRKAVELDAYPKSGDFMYSKARGVHNWIGDNDPSIKYSMMKDRCTNGEQAQRVFLPRQDQLQEMFGDRKEAIQHLIYKSSNFTTNSVSLDESLEIFWLRSVMLSKYDKVWGDGEWTLITRRNPEKVIEKLNMRPKRSKTRFY